MYYFSKSTFKHVGVFVCGQAATGKISDRFTRLFDHVIIMRTMDIIMEQKGSQENRFDH